MVIEVELPNGSIAEFPDGTAQDVMTNAIKQHLGGQQPQEDKGIFQTAGETVADFGKSLGTGLAELPLNVAAFATDVAGVTGGETAQPATDGGLNVSGRISQALGFLANPAEFLQDPDLRQELLNTDTQQLGQSFKNTLKNIDKIQAEASERSPIAAPAGEFVGQAAQLAGVPIAGAARGAKGVAGAGVLLGGALGGLQTDISQDLTPEQSLARRQETAATGALLGGAVGGGLQKTIQSAPALIEKAAKSLPVLLEKAVKSSPALLQKAAELAEKAPAFVNRGFARLAQINPQAANDFANLENAATLAAISDSPVIKQLDRFLATFTGGSKIIEKNTNKILGEIQGNLDNIGANKAVTPQEAGDIIKKGVGKFIGKFHTVSNKLYNRLDRIVPKDTPLTLNNTTDLLRKTIQSTTKGLQNTLRNGGGLSTLENIAADIAASAPVINAQGLRSQGKLSYNAIKRYRSIIGQQLSTPHLIQGDKRALLKQTYAALTKDMRSAFETKGEKAVKSFDRVNDFFSKGITSIENTLQKVVNKDAAGDVFQAALQGTKIGDFRIRSIMKSLSPEERDVVSGTVLQRMGMDVDDNFSIRRFLTSWGDKRLSVEAKNALFGAQDTKTRKSLDLIVRQAKRLEDINRFANPSKTAQNLTLGALLVTAAQNPIAAVTAVAGANISARLMTNKNFINLLGRWAEKKPTPNNISKFLRDAKIIVEKNPNIADDLSKYLVTLGIIAGQKK